MDVPEGTGAAGQARVVSRMERPSAGAGREKASSRQASRARSESTSRPSTPPPVGLAHWIWWGLPRSSRARDRAHSRAKVWSSAAGAPKWS